MSTKTPTYYQYQTNSQESLVLHGIIPYLLIAAYIILLVVLFFHFPFHPLLVTVMFLSFVAFLGFSKGGNECIMFDSKIIIVGERVTWYTSVESVSLDTTSRKLVLNKGEYNLPIYIESNLFNSRVRGETQQETHKKKKFDECAFKLLNKLKQYPHITITIDNQTIKE